MADELLKKKPDLGSGSSSSPAPKQAPIGTPAPKVEKPKAFSASPAPKQQLAPKGAAPKKMTVKPGNPNLGESAPVGVQRKRFESDKHVNKRLGKMFNETNAATLGVWNHDKKNDPMAKPDKVIFNSKLQYKPTEEQLKQAKLNSLTNRKKIMDQGFRPQSDDEANKLMEEEPQQQKAPKFNYDSISKELEGGEFVNIDAGLLPYEHGFETNGYEDLAVDARKGEDGKYELYMYPETENGPVSGAEPEYNEPTYVFDTFDDMKAFIENGYKKVEKKIEVPELQKLMSDNQKSYMPENENSGQELYDLLSNTKKEDIQSEIEKVFSGDYGKNDRVKTVLNDYLFNNMSVKQMSDKFGVSEGIISRLLGKGLNGLYLKLKNNERTKASELFGTDLNSPKKSEQDLRDFENSHPFEVEYDYDENGNRNGYELKFSKPEDQEAYEKLFAEVYGGK